MPPVNPPGVEKLNRILNEAVRPHAPELAVIGFAGDVAVVVFEPGEELKATARAIGWDGTSPVFRLAEEGRRALAESALAADARVAKWLRRKLDPAAPIARILVLTGADALLLNYGAYQGWFVEPEPAGGTVSN